MNPRSLPPPSRRRAAPPAAPVRPGPFSTPFIVILLFGAALLPRLFGLDRFLTSDERTNIYFAGSDVIAAFLRGDLRGTYWHFYPGVTMSWLDGLGMGGQYLLDVLTGSPPPFSQFIYGDILDLVVANRLPYALLTALFVPVTYLLVGQLLPPRLALLGALFLAVDPFFLAHSRVAHGDAPVAVFMTVSTLAFFIFIQHHRSAINNEQLTINNEQLTISNEQLAISNKQSFNPPVLQSSTPPPLHPSTLPPFHPSFLFLSAIAGGLAALTKAPGQFMAIFVVGLAFFYFSLDLWHAPVAERRQAARQWVRFWLKVIIIWGLVSLVTFVLLWPAMWVDPLGTLRQMLAETFGKVEEGHLVYFFGQPTLDPGPWFYPYVIPFRLTPVVLIGCVLSLTWLVLTLIPNKASRIPFFQPSILPTFHSSNLPLLHSSRLLWLFILSLLIFGTLSPKKQDRYLLPLFPVLDLIAAIGWLGLIHFVIDLAAKSYKLSFSSISNLQSPISNFLSLILLLLHLLPTLTYYPYYLTYFNPLLGGPTRAAETTLMGWGEGMEQVAAHLNTKPNAAQLYVASTPAQTLLPYFAGTGENFYTNDIAFRADYVVLYLAQIQRLAPSAEIVTYFLEQEPEKTIVIHGVDYAKIYPAPKRILTAVPPGATLTNFGLENVMRLAGYELDPTNPSVSHIPPSPGPTSLSSTSSPNRINPLPLQPVHFAQHNPSSPPAFHPSNPPTLQPSIPPSFHPSILPPLHPSILPSPAFAQNKSSTSNFQVTFYWHALAPIADNYTISVRLLAADGQRLAQQDQWPVNGLLPTSQWRQGDYVADTHQLELPPGSPAPAQLEVVVYNAVTHQPLGPVITIDNEQ